MIGPKINMLKLKPVTRISYNIRTRWKGLGYKVRNPRRHTHNLYYVGNERVVDDKSDTSGQTVALSVIEQVAGFKDYRVLTLF